jgi:hypothetical protein
MKLLGRQRRRWENNIKVGLKQGIMVWNIFTSLRIETSGGLL